MRRWPAALLAVALASTVLYRWSFTVYTGVPFSTDVWPLIGVVRRLLNSPSHGIFDDSFYDGYNNHWPMVILFSAAASLITGARPMVLMPLLIPLVNAFSIVFIVLIVRRLVGRREAYASAIVLAFALPLLVFVSAATKEGFAHPLLAMLCYVITVLGPGSSGARARVYLVSAVSCLALVLAHHLTTFMLLYIGAIYLVAALLLRVKLGVGARVFPAPLAIAGVLAAIHYVLVGFGRMRVVVGWEEAVELVMYTVFFTLTPLLLASARRASAPRPPLLLTLACTPVVAGFMVYGVYSSPAPGLPPLGLSGLLYGVLFLLAPLLIPLSYSVLKHRGSGLLPLFMAWITGCLGLSAYLLLGNSPLGPPAIHRVLDFLAVMVSIGTGIAAAYLYGRGGLWRAVAIGVVAAVASSAIGVAAMLVCGVDSVSFYWLYRRSDYSAALFVGGHIGANASVACGAKYGYLLESLRVEGSCTPVASLVYDGVVEDRTLYILYRENYVWGVACGIAVISVSGGASRLLEYCASRVYDSMVVGMYFG